MSALPQPLPSIPKEGNIMSIMQDILAEQEKVYDEVCSTVTPETACFDNVVRPIVDIRNRNYGKRGVIAMLGYCAADMATHDAVAAARKLQSKEFSKWGAREDIFHLIKAVHDKDEPIDAESRLWVVKELLDKTQSGHGVMKQAEIEVWLKAMTDIEHLKSEFTRNLSSDNGGLWFSVEELEGVPATALERWADGTESPNLGKKFVPFANNGSSTIMGHCSNADTRMRMFLAENKGAPRNAQLFREIALGRDSQARLQGYGSHAAFRMESRVAKSAEWVEEFLKKLREGLIPRGREELRILQQRRVQDLKERGTYEEGDDAYFPPWDKGYYSRLVKEDLKVDQFKISDFFPLEETAAAMLNVFASFFNLRFTKLPPEEILPEHLWHESIQVFSVWDEGTAESSFVGYLYLDLLFREHKYRGNQNVTMEVGYLKPDGTRHYPSTILECAFPTPTSTRPPLLQHTNVVTLFHELGHGVHNLLSRTKYARFHGTNLPHDFGEAPSYMLENWCWMKDVLKQLSCHYTTLDPLYLKHWREQNAGEPVPPKEIPDDLVDNLIKHRNVNRAQWMLHQLVVSIFDMRIHNPKSHQELEDMDLTALWWDLREELEGIGDPKARYRDRAEYATFGHLINGYDAGYYGYLCCLAYAEDMFQARFAADPRSKETWEAYRREILQYGGGHPDHLQMLADFLGRPTNPDALIESLER